MFDSITHYLKNLRSTKILLDNNVKLKPLSVITIKLFLKPISHSSNGISLIQVTMGLLVLSKRFYLHLPIPFLISL